ncbi:hypothetical protein PJI16_19920 [Nitrospira sp. MA-1]|nr:hypothetical protein [Nitrospira sp. MA-1]
MSIQDYIAAQRANISSISQLPHFSKLGDLTYRLYESAVSLVPRSFPRHFGLLLLICHRSFLSALTLIGQAQPDDAAPISRRAIEAARLALAVKTNPESAREWFAHEQRMERWQARYRGEKPKKPVIPKLDLPSGHLILAKLEEHLGILSDSSVHFTPEYYGSQHWIRNGTKYELLDFTPDQRAIECSLIILIGLHGSILRIFDECLDGPFFSDDQWKQVWEQKEIIGRQLVEATEGLEEA